MTFARILGSFGLLASLAACGAAPSTDYSREFGAGLDPASLQLDRDALEAELERASTARVSIYNAATVLTVPNPLNRGVKVLNDGERTLQGTLAPWLVTRSALAAHRNLADSLAFYADVFGRDGYDGRGAEVKASVDVQRYHLIPILGLKGNAAWMQPFKMFIFGAGDSRLGGFAEALDVVGHEFTHAVVSSTSNLQYVGESGALNEHLADVFGELIQHRVAPDSEPFLIGETTLRGDFAQQARALRDMLQPGKGLSKQPAHMNEYPAEFGPDCRPSSSNDNCGVHILSGIPNRAAALTIQEIGWDAAAKLYYAVMTERLTETSNFRDYREALLAECAASLTAAQCGAVERGLVAVGL